MNARWVCIGIAAVLLFAGVAQGESVPKVVKVSPEIGAKDVDPALTEISVTFDQEMGGGASWTGGGEAFPETTGKMTWSADKKTCTLPVKLKPGAFHRVGINSSSHRNFQSAAGQPAEFNVIYFATKGADEATLAKLAVPKVVSLMPENASTNVIASTERLVVTFDRPMGGGMSWTKAEGVQPEGAGQAVWNADNTVCTLPVKVVAGQTYSIGLNHPFANNFQSAAGVPLVPVVWTFTTAK